MLIYPNEKLISKVTGDAVKRLLPFFLTLTLWGQTETHLPWVAQNGIFQTTIIINNYNPKTISVTLIATRPGETAEEETLEIGPYANVEMSAGSLFTQLGEGPGYTVTLTSSESNLSAAAIIASTTTVSGDSPSQMNAVPMEEAAQKLSYNYLPITDTGFSAPVIVNVGSEMATITLRGFQEGEVVGEVQQMLLPGEVFARQTSELFPEVTGGLYIVAEGDQPLVGSTFLFNGLREPAMTAAVPLDAEAPANP